MRAVALSAGLWYNKCRILCIQEIRDDSGYFTEPAAQQLAADAAAAGQRHRDQHDGIILRKEAENVSDRA